MQNEDDDLLLGAVEEEEMAQQSLFGEFDSGSNHVVGSVAGSSSNHNTTPIMMNNGHPQSMLQPNFLLSPLLSMSLNPMHTMNPLYGVSIPPIAHPLGSNGSLSLLGMLNPLGAPPPPLHTPQQPSVSYGHKVMPKEEAIEEEQDSYEVYDDDKQEPTEFPTLAQEDVTNEQRLDEILTGLSITEEQERIKYYVQHGVKYTFVAQWRNPLIHSIRENVIVKHVVDFNPYFGIVVIVEPLYLSHDKKKKKSTVDDLRRTGFYVHAVDLYGMKKKSVIGRLLDDHRKYIKRCVLVNQTKECFESNDVLILKTKCETKIPKINEITSLINSAVKLKSSDDSDLVTIVNRYESHGGNPPQKLNKKIDVVKALEVEDINERITALCPPGTGCINDLSTLVRYATTCCKFPFDAKVTSLYSFLNDQQVEFTVSVNSVNYRCKQGIIFKATITSGTLSPIDGRFKVHIDNDDDAGSDDDDEPYRKKRKMSGSTPFDTYTGTTIKVDSSRLRVDDSTKSVNLTVLMDYQTWFIHSTLLDEKKIDEQWTNLRFYLQFVD